MLVRKMLREMRSNWGQFLSVFLLAFLALSMFCTFEGHVIGQHKARAQFHKEVNLATLWMYGEGFIDEDLEHVRDLDFVDSAQLRMSVTGSAPDCGGAQVDLYLERENVVNQPYLIEGEVFDPTDTEGIWLTNAFAKLWNINVGDDFTVEYKGITFTREVKGLIESAEYEYRQADGDADVYLDHIAFVYMSYDAFPIRDYVTHLIEQGKITAKKVAEETTALDEQLDKLSTQGISVDDITQDMLLNVVDKMSDEKLAKIMPYTQMIIRTNDGKGLSYEEEIADAIDDHYAAMVDEKSVPGLARLDSELDQHESFSYLFVVIFVGIAILVIATSMSRIVEKQRTQIGTMNALGMKKRKIMMHYLNYSLWVALLGSIAGIVVGMVWLAPIMVGIFAQYYIVPGLHAGFDSSYGLIALAVVLACVLAAYFSCRKILRIRPAEALRPAAPKQGKSCIFEKLPFWKHLGFNTQYNLRDISRGKLRAFMCVIGTAVGMLLMVYGIACNTLLDQMEALNFEKVQPANYELKLSADAKLEDMDAIVEETDGELMMTDQIELAKQTNAMSDQKKKETIIVLEGKGLYNVVDTKQSVITIEPGKVGLSRKMSEDLDLQVGDTFYWHIYTENTWHEATVGYIYQSVETQGIVYLREDLEAENVDFTPSMLLSNEDLSAYKNRADVTGMNSRQEMIDAYETSMEIVQAMVFLMVGFSVILIVVVLYNSGNLSFYEREKEFATLKVLGFQSGQLRRILSVQNFWLSLIGIILGAPFGRMTFNAMMNSNGDNFDYNLIIPAGCYIISGILVLGVSVLVSYLFAKRIRKLDMVEVLKGAE